MLADADCVERLIGMYPIRPSGERVGVLAVNGFVADAMPGILETADVRFATSALSVAVSFLFSGAAKTMSPPDAPAAGNWALMSLSACTD